MDIKLGSILERVVSLGDNSELDNYLRLKQISGQSLFRWSICPAELLPARLKIAPLFAGYNFEKLQACAAAMVLDVTDGIRFNTQMRSVTVPAESSNALQFIDDPATRRVRHGEEYERYIQDSIALYEKLTQVDLQIFVIKSNHDIQREVIFTVDNLLRQRRLDKPYLLMVVQQNSAENPICDEPSWLTDTIYLAPISALAAYSQSNNIDADAWDAVFGRLQKDTRFTDLFKKSSCRIATLDVPAFADGWNTKWSVGEKKVAFATILNSGLTVADLRVVYAKLEHTDVDFHAYSGARILHAVERGYTIDDDMLADDFDNRFVRLIAAYSNTDLDAALHVHGKCAELFRQYGNSFVRYKRVADGIASSKLRLQEFADGGAQIVDIAPLNEEKFAHAECTSRNWRQMLAESDNSLPLKLSVRYDPPYERTFTRLSTADHHELAADKWVEKPIEGLFEHAHVYVLEHARISCWPACVSFSHQNAHRTIAAMSDMYHHSSVAGKIGLSAKTKIIPEAYILPRFGPPGNHYHSLIDKLPSAVCYKLLGLDCPLLSAYELNSTEQWFFKQLGINLDSVIVDSNAEYIATRAYVAQHETSRPLFFDYCRSLSNTASPAGKRLYISRSDASGRGMVNEHAVEDLLAARGFDVVSMEQYSLEQQMALCANADLVVAPHGAGLANMIFRAAGGQIVELIPERYMVRFFWQLAADCGHAYSVLVGKMIDVGKSEQIGQAINWQVDLNALSLLIDDIESQKVCELAAENAA